MSPVTAGIVGIGVLLTLMVAGMPIGFSMLLIGSTGFIYLVKLSGAIYILTRVPYGLISNYDYCVLPLFLLMASICLNAGLGRSLFRMAYVWIGRLPGGLSVATIGACAFFGAVSASSIATAVTIGVVAVPEMKRYKYDRGLIAGSVAAGGTLGILIPPSGVLIIYGIMTEQSIAKLFVAGIIPGIILALMFMAMIYIRARLNPRLAPPGPSTSLKEKMAAVGDGFEMIILFLLILVGLTVGWFTPTEAGAIGAFGAIAFSQVRRRLSWQGFKDSVIDTLRNTGMIFTILVGALVFSAFLAVTTIPMELAGWVGGLGLPPLFIMALIILVYIVLGTFFDEMAMILLTIPIFYPVATALGFDPIWFGIVIVVVVEIGMISPPVGMTMFVVKGIDPDIPIETVFKGVLPFVVVVAIFLVLLVAFPQMALILPRIMG